MTLRCRAGQPVEEAAEEEAEEQARAKDKRTSSERSGTGSKVSRSRTVAGGDIPYEEGRRGWFRRSS